MSEHLSEAEHEKLLERAEIMGQEHGKAAGSWPDVHGGNAAKILRGIDDGEHWVYEMMGSPLSGEHAEDRTPASLLRSLGVPEMDAGEDHDVCSAYEAGYSEGWEGELGRRARYQLD